MQNDIYQLKTAKTLEKEGEGGELGDNISTPNHTEQISILHSE